MKFSYNWLKKLTDMQASPQELAEFLTMRVFEVESVEKIGEDWAINISGKTIGPRIADASGHIGMAREIAALKNINVKSEEPRIKEDKKKKADDVLKIKIENPEDCPRYTARVITDIKIGPSPEWMRERLVSCGIQSINNVVDAANYAMLELGQPLHVFDMQKLKSKNEKIKTITIRRAKEHEKMVTFDNKIMELNSEVLVIADEEKPVAIAGIKGGKEYGVSDSSTALILESANFSPARIHKGSQILGLRTDASYRFEHGLDSNQTVVAVDRLVELIQQLAGGVILAGRVDSYPYKPAPIGISFRTDYANLLIGDALPQSFYKNVFLRLGCRVRQKRELLMVTPPTLRRDLCIEEDLIEEAARLYGYGNITPRLPEVALVPASRNDGLFWEERARDILAGAGFVEAQPYEFTGDRELEAFGFSADSVVALENAMSPDTKYLVPRLLIKYVVAAGENLHNFDDVRLFGTGKSFLRSGEQKNLVLARAHKGVDTADEFYEVKGVVDVLLESMGISEYWYNGAVEPRSMEQGLEIFHPYRVAEIKIDGEKIGVMGEIHPDVLKNIKSNGRIVIADIDFDVLAKHASADAEYRTVGKYPSVIRDIAVLVPATAKTEEALNIIENLGSELLVDADLFDYFQDEQMRERDVKSFAFHLVFRSSERTLTDVEIDAIIKKITVALEEKGWEVRK